MDDDEVELTPPWSFINLPRDPDKPTHAIHFRQGRRAKWQMDAHCRACHFPIRVVGVVDTSQRIIDREVICPNCGARYDMHMER